MPSHNHHQPLPPIRQFLATELALPLPRHYHDTVDPTVPRRTRAFTLSSFPDQWAHPAPRSTPTTPARRSFPPTSRPRHRTPTPSPTSPPPLPPTPPPRPAYAYNILRPSPSGTLITSVPTVRARSRSMPHPAPSSSSSAPHAQSERRHVCPVCHKRFNRPSSLRTHGSVHTGSRPYACAWPGCGKVFSVASNMRRHQVRAHSAREGGSVGDGAEDDGEEDEGEDEGEQDHETYETYFEWAPPSYATR